MKLCKIKDNQRNDASKFSEIEFLVSKIANKTLEQLERDGVFVFPESVKGAEDITKDQMILRSVNNEYWSSNVMGILGYGEERLFIESRFNDEDNDFFFRYMLQKLLNPNVVDLPIGANREESLFDLFLLLFPLYLKRALRKGLYKKYIRRKYNDENVRGTIDIARHIEKNVPFLGKVAYSQREFSFDNSLMELVRHTIEFIKGKRYGSSLLGKVGDEVKLVVNTTPRYKLQDRQRIIEANKKDVIRHAYYKEYLALQKLCLLILRNQKHQIGSGSKQIYGVLFDGAWLWEEYVNTLISKAFYHPQNKQHIASQRLFTRVSDGKKVGLIYPDFIGRDDQNRVIADAKYKPSDNIGSSNGDYLQLLAYMFRFDAQTGYFLYPKAKEEPNTILLLNSGSTFDNHGIVPRKDICVIKHGLRIPTGATTYEDFTSLMKESEEEFAEQLFSACLEEA